MKILIIKIYKNINNKKINNLIIENNDLIHNNSNNKIIQNNKNKILKKLK